jgi:hypothetical protein
MARVLVACEYSGRVRDAFTAAGHEAVSADLLPSESPNGKHYQGDARDLLGEPWDLLIAHPPCTYLTNAGVRFLHEPEDDSGYLKGPARWAAMREGAELFQAFLNAEVPRICVENPVMHKHARDGHDIGRATQFVQPWQFGDMQCKRTGLWLRNLPPLVDTQNVKAATMALPVAERSAIHYASPGKGRGKLRSTTFPGLANAMAAQWGPLL